MGADIDQLNIKIEADAQKAHSSVDTLISKLGRLNSALGGINTNNLTSLSNDFNNFASSVRSFNSLDTKKIVDVSNGFKKFEKINAGNIGKLSDSLKPLSEGIGALNSVNFDNKSLQNLINSITRLSNSNVGNLSNVDFTSLGNSIKSLASSLSGAENVQRATISMTNAVANLAKSGSNIASVSSELPRLSNVLSNFIRSMSKVNTVVPETIAFTQAIGSLANAGAKTATTASHLGILSQELKKFMETMSTAPVVNRNIIDMTNSLAKLASAGASSGRAATSLGKSLNFFTASSNSAMKSSFSLSRAIGKVYASYWLLFRAFGKIRDAIDISSKLTEVQNVVDVTFGDMAYKVEDFAKTSIEQFGMSELSLKQYASRFQAMGSAMGVDKSLISNANSFLSAQTNGYIGLSDSMSDVSLNLTKLTADMASFYNVEQADVAEDLEAIFTGMTRPLRTYGLDLTEATLKEWAMKNGLDANIDSMTQAEKTMLRYQYVLANTGAAQGDFARTADTWANQVRILKQNFEQLGSVVGGTFINALKPMVKALNAAMGSVISFAQVVSNALGKIFGWQYESGSGGIANDLNEAEDSADGIANGIGDATDNAKKLKNTLLGIDEINALTDNSDSDSGSGSGSGSSGTSGASASGGGWVKTDSIFEDYKSNIDSLYGLGDYIGSVLTKEMNGINWDSVYLGAKSFGTGFASFLNGLISPELFGATGQTIAGALNTAIYAALSFEKIFSWTNLGESVASGINNFFATFDFKAAGLTLYTFADGILKAMKEAVGDIKWKYIGQDIADFFSEINWGNLAWDLVGLAEAIVGAIDDALTGFASENPLAASVIGLVATAKLTGLDKTLGSAMSTFLTGKIIPLTSTLNVSVATAVIAVVGTWEFFFERGKDIGKALFPDDAEIYDNFSWFGDGGFFDSFKGSDFNDISYALTQLSRDFNGTLGIMDKFREATGIDMTSGLIEQFNNLKEKMDESGVGIDDLAFKISEFVVGSPQEILNWFESVKPFFERGVWGAFGSNIKSALSGAWNGFVAWWETTGFYSWWNNNVTPWFTKEKWQGLGENIKSALSGKWDEFTRWWKGTGFYDWWTDITSKFDKKKWSFSGIKQGLSEAWSNAIDSIKGLWNKFASWLNQKLTINIDTSTVIGKGVSAALGSTKISLGKIPMYASGGYPNTGELFLARENGLTEMVGSIGSRPAVANNDQIVAGIQSGVEAAMMNVMMAFAGTMGGGNSETPIIENVIKCDSETLYRAVQKGKDKHDRRYHVVTEF